MNATFRFVYRITMRVARVALVLCGFSTSPLAAELQCPEPLKQVSKDVLIDAKIQVGALGKLSAGEVDGKVDAISQDLISKYPNADKVAVVHSVISLSCEVIKTSTTLTDREKIEYIDKLNAKILDLFKSPKADAALDIKVVFADENDGEYLRFIHNGVPFFSLITEMHVVLQTQINANACSAGFYMMQIAADETINGDLSTSDEGVLPDDFSLDKEHRTLKTIAQTLAKRFNTTPECVRVKELGEGRLRFEDGVRHVFYRYFSFYVTSADGSQHDTDGTPTSTKSSFDFHAQIVAEAKRDHLFVEKLGQDTITSTIDDWFHHGHAYCDVQREFCKSGFPLFAAQ